MRTMRSLWLLSSLMTAARASPATTSSCGTVLKLECQKGEMIVVHEAAFTPHKGSRAECEKGWGVNRSSSERHNNRWEDLG